MASEPRIPYEPPKYQANGFNCPYSDCMAFAEQSWRRGGTEVGPRISVIDGFQIAECARCRRHSYWIAEQLIWPSILAADPPHQDMPADCAVDFEEARAIYGRSPRGAAALLRLVTQKLMPHLQERGENLNDDIAALVAKGLPVDIQRALDACRVIGNNAVHPGEMALTDTPDIALELFSLVNFIVDDRIRRPKEIASIYRKLPVGAIEKIEKRDGSA